MQHTHTHTHTVCFRRILRNTGSKRQKKGYNTAPRGTTREEESRSEHGVSATQLGVISTISLQVGQNTGQKAGRMEGAGTRFEMELELMNSLASPEYLHCERETLGRASHGMALALSVLLSAVYNTVSPFA